MRKRTGGGALGKPYEHCRVLGPREVVDGGHDGCVCVSLGLLELFGLVGSAIANQRMTRRARVLDAETGRRQSRQSRERQRPAGAVSSEVGVVRNGRTGARCIACPSHGRMGWGWSSPFGGVSAAPARQPAPRSKLSTASQSPAVSDLPRTHSPQILRGSAIGLWSLGSSQASFDRIPKSTLNPDEAMHDP